jgi:hypothetical protein
MKLTLSQFHKHFTHITHCPNKISCTIIHWFLMTHCMHTLCFKTALAYFAIPVIYTHKMFMKLTPGFGVVQLFVIRHWRSGFIKLECLYVATFLKGGVVLTVPTRRITTISISARGIFDIQRNLIRHYDTQNNVN